MWLFHIRDAHSDHQCIRSKSHKWRIEWTSQVLKSCYAIGFHLARISSWSCRNSKVALVPFPFSRKYLEQPALNPIIPTWVAVVMRQANKNPASKLPRRWLENSGMVVFALAASQLLVYVSTRASCNSKTDKGNFESTSSASNEQPPSSGIRPSGSRQIKSVS